MKGFFLGLTGSKARKKQNKRLLTSFEPLKDQPQSFYPSLCQPSYLYKISPQFISSGIKFPRFLLETGVLGTFHILLEYPSLSSI